VDAYSDDLIDHADHPHNRALLTDPSGVGAMRNPVCGDVLQLTVRIEDGMVAAIGWDGKGCLPSIGAASMLSELIKGRSFEDAMAYTEADLIADVGGLPTTKLHSASLAIGALRMALHDYATRPE
jgi:nitrogen fixation NifU-like protein